MCEMKLEKSFSEKDRKSETSFHVSVILDAISVLVNMKHKIHLTENLRTKAVKISFWSD